MDAITILAALFVLILAAWVGAIVLDMLSRAPRKEKINFAVGIAILGLLVAGAINNSGLSNYIAKISHALFVYSCWFLLAWWIVGGTAKSYGASDNVALGLAITTAAVVFTRAQLIP